MKNMVRIAAAATIAVLALAGVAQAEEPPVGGPTVEGPGAVENTPTAQHVECKPVAGNPELEEQLRQSQHPPQEPNGEPSKPKADGPKADGLCPPGELAVSEPHAGGPKHRPPSSVGAADVAPASLFAGYHYVSDEWALETKTEGFIIAAEVGNMASSPVVPPTAAEGAHSVDQMWLFGGKTNAEGAAQYSLEFGWTKEAQDQAEGYKGGREFLFINNGYYAEGHTCYDCGFVLAAGNTYNPFGMHFKPQDGSPEAECPTQGTKGEAARCQTPWQFKFTKKAWWIWEFGRGWIGYVPCSEGREDRAAAEGGPSTAALSIEPERTGRGSE